MGVDISPTWSNGRCCSAGIAKHIDRFFLSDILCDSLGRYRVSSLALCCAVSECICLPLIIQVYFRVS